MLKLQRCNSVGSDISDDGIIDDQIHGDDVKMFRHRCIVKGIYYYRTVDDSLVWPVYNDDKGMTRCKHCNKLWILKC